MCRCWCCLGRWARWCVVSISTGWQGGLSQGGRGPVASRLVHEHYTLSVLRAAHLRPCFSVPTSCSAVLTSCTVPLHPSHIICTHTLSPVQSDKDILSHIVYDFSDYEMMEALRPSIEEAAPITSQALALDYIGKRASQV